MAYVDFTAIDKMLTKAQNISEVAAWLFSVDREVQTEIIRLNTEDQLEESGIDSLGNILGEYSPVTVMLKRLKGDRFDHITLKDEGDFHESFTVQVVSDGWVVDAVDTGKYDRPLFDVYGVDVLGLTDENLEFIKEMILEKYIEYVYRELLP